MRRKPDWLKISMLLTSISIVVYTFYALLSWAVDATADEWIPAGVHVEHCLTWKEHQAAYPAIEGEDLLESMLQECER